MPTLPPPPPPNWAKYSLRNLRIPGRKMKKQTNNAHLQILDPPHCYKVCSFSIFPSQVNPCDLDNDPPNVTCSNVTATSTFPNSYPEPIEDVDYTYYDDNPNTKFWVCLGQHQVWSRWRPAPSRSHTYWIDRTWWLWSSSTCVFYFLNTRKYEHVMLFLCRFYLYQN